MKLQEEKALNRKVKELDNEMKRLKALIEENLWKSYTVVYEGANGIYTVTCNPSRKESIRKDDLSSKPCGIWAEMQKSENN